MASGDDLDFEGQQYGGPFQLDVKNLAHLIIDLAPGVLGRMRREYPDLDKVLLMLAKVMPTKAATDALAPQAAYQTVLECEVNIAQIRAARADVDKLAEVLRESEAKFVHERETALSLLADAVKGTAKRKHNPSLAAPFELLITYLAQATEEAVKAAAKAAETRRAQKSATPDPAAPAKPSTG
jgi:hypothetical protein